MAGPFVSSQDFVGETHDETVFRPDAFRNPSFEAPENAETTGKKQEPFQPLFRSGGIGVGIVGEQASADRRRTHKRGVATSLPALPNRPVSCYPPATFAVSGRRRNRRQAFSMLAAILLATF